MNFAAPRRRELYRGKTGVERTTLPIRSTPWDASDLGTVVLPLRRPIKIADLLIMRSVMIFRG
jgi:hypothetical protein